MRNVVFYECYRSVFGTFNFRELSNVEVRVRCECRSDIAVNPSCGGAVSIAANVPIVYVAFDYGNAAALVEGNLCGFVSKVLSTNADSFPHHEWQCHKCRYLWRIQSAK